MQKIIVFAAAVFLTGLGVCRAQPPGITREMISRALPLEGAPKAEPGPYQVTSEPAFGAPGLQVYRPAALDAFPAKDTLPVMVWGNGGCGIDSKTFSGFLSTIVSHGVLVVSTVPVEGAARRQETADDMRAAIDWAEKENARAGSPLNGKIAIDKVAAMGTSCGGFLSLTLGADPRVKSIGVFNSRRRNRLRTRSPNCTGRCCRSTAANPTSRWGRRRRRLKRSTRRRRSTGRGTTAATARRTFIQAASSPTLPRTGSCGRSKAKKKPPIPLARVAPSGAGA